MKVEKNSTRQTLTLIAVWLLVVGSTMAVAAKSAAETKGEKQNAAWREKAKQQRVRELLSEGLAAYRKNDMGTAVARWREVLLIDPANERATIFLKQVAPEFERLEAGRRELEQTARAETEAARKMSEKVSIEVREGTRLHEFLNTLSFVTGINFVIVRGADVPVVAKFEDQSLRDILDAVLDPNGLSWTRKGDIVTIVPELRTRVFPLDSDTLLKAQRLYETNELQRILWNADAPPIQGIELNLDERQSVLILTDSPENVEKMAQLLAELPRAAAPKLISRVYAVRSDLADDVKTLVEAMLRTEAGPAYERRVLLAKHERGADLIVKDTEANLRLVESLLDDPKFLRHLEEEDIEVYTVNLTPRDVMTANPEQVEAFGRNVKEVVETMLYHKEGVVAAQAQGRRLWFDPATLQMTITDRPSNIRKVAEFVQALPQLEPKRRSKIIFLEYAMASELASQLEEILGIAPAVAAGVPGGMQASFSLRVEDERTFRDLSIRLVRVNENTYGDENDDSCELVVRTSTAQSSDLNIPEYRSEVFEEYEILVEEVDPSPTPGEGRAKLRVTYRPELGAGAAY